MRKFTASFLMVAALAVTLATANLVEAGRGGGGRSAGRSAPFRSAQAMPQQSQVPPVAGQAPQSPTAGDKTAPKSTPANPTTKDTGAAKTSKQQQKKQKKKSGGGGGGGGGDGGGDDGGGDGGSGDGGSGDGVEEGSTEESSAPAASGVTEMAGPAPAEGATPVTNEIDVELVEVRCVDAGNAAKNQGPCFRVSFRNNSQSAIGQKFRVAILASLGRSFTAASPHAVAEVPGMKAGEVLAVDLRLPVKANTMGRNVEGRSLPFAWLAAAVDCDGVLNDANRENNAAILGRLDIPMVEGE